MLLVGILNLLLIFSQFSKAFSTYSRHIQYNYSSLPPFENHYHCHYHFLYPYYPNPCFITYHV